MKNRISNKIVMLALLAAVISILAGWTTNAGAAPQFVYKYANNLPATHPMTVSYTHLTLPTKRIV